MLANKELSVELAEEEKYYFIYLRNGRLCAHVTPNVNKNTNVVTWVFIRGSSGMLSL